MNTSKQVNIMVALIFLSVFATGAYTLWDPTRADDAEEKQLEREIGRGAWLFSQNCRVCHGNAGEGGGASNRLAAAPALNVPRLRGEDSETGVVDETERDIQFKRVFYTITCGRVGRAMPNWGDTQGGPLNEEQIKQLARLITHGGEGWDQAEEYALHGVPEYGHHGDLDSPLRLARALDASSTEVFVLTVDPAVKIDRAEAAVLALGKGVRLQIGEELMVITDVNKEAKSVTVERSLGSTEPAAHEEGAQVLTPPVPPDPAPVTGATCGQSEPLPARPTPTEGPAGPTPTPAAGEQVLEIVGANILFDKSELTATAGSPIRVVFDNQDQATPHNFAVYDGADASGDIVAATDIVEGPVQQELTFGPLEPGSYFYQCDVHPDSMTGTLTVQ